MRDAKLIIVDDAHMVAEMLAATMEREAGLQVAGLARNAREALTLTEKTRPDLALVDIQLPDVCGLDLIGSLRKAHPAVKIIMLSAHLDPYIVFRVVRSGVHGYVEKLSPMRLLREAVRCVLKGGSYFSPGFSELKARHLDSAAAFHKILTEREQRILQLMCEGLSDADIAARRSISEPTVATNRKRIRAKLNLHSDRELLTYARRCGLGLRGPPILG